MKNYITKFSEIYRKLFARIGSDPRKDWKIFLFVTLTLLIILFVYHISLFFSSYTETSGSAVSGPSSVKVLDKEGLSNAIKNLESKKNRYENFVSNPPVLRDPSF